MATINNIKPGAMAYSPDGMRTWGAVPEEKRKNVILGTIIGDKVVIDYPLWTLDPQRKFSVERIYIEIVTVPDNPPDPNPTIHVTHTLLTYSDGSVDFDGVHYS
jgi:hypothetical protein